MYVPSPILHIVHQWTVPSQDHRAWSLPHEGSVEPVGPCALSRAFHLLGRLGSVSEVRWDILKVLLVDEIVGVGRGWSHDVVVVVVVVVVV